MLQSLAHASELERRQITDWELLQIFPRQQNGSEKR